LFLIESDKSIEQFTVRCLTTQVKIPVDRPPAGLRFPCIDKQNERSVDGGPEPMYSTIVSGFEVSLLDIIFIMFTSFKIFL